MERPTTDLDWEPYKNQIKEWYVDEGRSKTQVATLLRAQGFPVSYSQLQYRLRDWGFQRFTRKRPGSVAYGGVIPPCGHDPVSQAKNPIHFGDITPTADQHRGLQPVYLTENEQRLLVEYQRQMASPPPIGSPPPPLQSPRPLPYGTTYAASGGVHPSGSAQHLELSHNAGSSHATGSAGHENQYQNHNR